MQQAQREIAFEKYLKPALDACAGSGFVLPLSLAVIYDSMNHGSWAKIRDRVSASDKNERAWITEYVRDRDAWLESVPRLAPTDYRTDFFLAQIARGNWNMNLPLNVHGYQLTENLLFPRGSNDAEADTASAAANSQPEEPVAPAGSVPDAQATTAEEMQPPAISVPPSPPNKTDVVVEKEPDVVEVKPKGFFGSLWQKVTGAFGGGVTADVAIEKAQQAQTLGLSERTWGFIFWAIIAGLAIWIVYHFVVQKVVPWGRWILGRMRTNQLVAGNATADSVQVISADKLAEYEAKGYLVVRRS
jgi:hypothetical protein